MNTLKHISLYNFISEKGKVYSSIPLSYQLFGKPLYTAPIVLINHALTGNSNVTGSDGWWNAIVGNSKLIDTKKYTIIAFNIPGNAYKTNEILFEFDEFSANDVAKLFGVALQQLNIFKLYAAVGSSLGGGIAWEMAVLFPDLIENLIPIASDWKTTDWILGHNRVQFQILENSKHPLKDARMMAMLFYRTPASFDKRFNKSINKELDIYNIESWLIHHGNKLESRFTLHAYKVMTHLLSSVNCTKNFYSVSEAFKTIQAKVTMVGINSDLFFVPEENINTVQLLKNEHKKACYKEINSIHGHDAFLIEYKQLINLLKEIF